MKKRMLGFKGPIVSALGMGCMGIAEFYGKSNPKEARCTLDKAIELGITLFDTADMYGRGLSEQYVGEAIQTCRKKIILSTKFGFVRENDDVNDMQLDGSPEYVKIACENSLRRLKTDYIDIYFLHRVDPKIPVEETIGAMKLLVEQGKIRYLGMSDTTVENLERALKIHPIHAYQGEYSLWHRDPEITHLEDCKKLNISFMPYSPLGRGFLTGRLNNLKQLDKDDFRKVLPRFQDKNYNDNLSLLEKIKLFANNKGCTTAQLALSWVLAQAPDIVPIPGGTLPAHIEENIKAIDVNLSTDDLKLLNKMMPIGIAKGAQYPEMEVH